MEFYVLDKKELVKVDQKSDNYYAIQHAGGQKENVTIDRLSILNNSNFEVDLRKEKWFKIYWRDGKESYVKGFSIEEAFIQNGYNNVSINIMDYYIEATEVPNHLKNFFLTRKNGDIKQMYLGSMFMTSVLEQLEKETTDKVTVVMFPKSKQHRKVWELNVEIKPFEIHLTEI